MPLAVPAGPVPSCTVKLPAAPERSALLTGTVASPPFLPKTTKRLYAEGTLTCTVTEMVRLSNVKFTQGCGGRDGRAKREGDRGDRAGEIVSCRVLTW